MTRRPTRRVKDPRLGFAEGAAAIREAARDTVAAAPLAPKPEEHTARRLVGAGENGRTLVLPPEGYGNVWSGGAR